MALLDLEKLRRDINILFGYVRCLMAKSDENCPLVATEWSANHTNITGNPYTAGTYVFWNGHVYKCLFNNEGIPPTNTTYWLDLGEGHLLAEEQSDWNSTGGRAFILNKPTNTSDFINDGEDGSSPYATEVYVNAAIPLPQDLDSVLTEGDTAQDKEINVESIGLYDDFAVPFDFARIYADKSRINFSSKLGNLMGYIQEESFSLVKGPFTFTISLPTLTSNRIATFQNSSGVVAYLSDIGSTLLSNITPDAYLGLRLQPTDPLNNGFYINKSVNESVGYYARNTDNVGNGATAGVYVGGTGALYDNYAAFFHANSGYFVPYLQGKNGISSNNDFFFVGYNGASFDFRTGAGTFGGETSKFSISNTGVLKIGVQPATGTISDFILLRDTSGNIKQIAYPSVTPSPLTTKGDLYTYSTVDARLPVGTDGQILTANSAVPEGLSWQDNYADWTSVVKHIVKNNGLSGTITKGTAVYVTSSDGTNMLVGRASNTSEATSSKTMGLMQSNITTTGGTQTGFVITEGLLSGLNTAGTTAGDPVWLGVNGALIYGLINKPYAPDHLVFIGIVTKVSAGSGEIFVKVQNGFELREIHDVDLITTTPINGHILGFDGTLWVNKTIAGWLGFTPQQAITLTTTGTSGAATLISNTLNIPQYGGGGSSQVKLSSQTLSFASWTLVGSYYEYTFSNANIVSTGFVTFTPNNASINEVSTCRMLPQIDAATGTCKFYSLFPPQTNIVGEIVIFIL